MSNFIGGLPAQGSPLTSAEIRDNFLALNARTGKITPRATNPASTSVTIDGGTVYFSDRISIQLDAQSVDLGDGTTGISPFTNTGFFRDVAIVLRLSFDEATSRHEVALAFVEGPEKSSSVADESLVPIGSMDLPVARFLVRHNGINTTDLGQIEPIVQDSIIDFRNYLDVGGTTYFSTTVGDREVQTDAYGTLLTDAYGVAIITGETIGAFVGSDNPIQEAIDSLTTGGTILIKRGSYQVSEPILVPDNIQLLGEGGSTVIEMLNTFTGPMFIVSGSNVHFLNLTLQGPLPDAGIVSEALIAFVSSENSTVKDCHIDTGIVGIAFDSASNRNICMNNYFGGNSIGVSVAGDKNIVTYNQFEDKLSDDVVDTGSGNLTSPNVLS